MPSPSSSSSTYGQKPLYYGTSKKSPIYYGSAQTPMYYGGSGHAPYYYGGAYGGQAVAVYQDSNRAAVENLLSGGRVDFIFPADYREGGELDVLIRGIIESTAAAEKLEKKHEECAKR